MAKKNFGFGDRFCTVCGERVEKNAAACPRCGRPYGNEKYAGVNQTGAGGVGYSSRADDPTLKTQKKKGKAFGFVFLLLFSVGVAAYLLISKQVPATAEGYRNVGLVVGAIWLIDLLWYLSSLRKKKDWEGVVERKEHTTETRSRRDSDGDSHLEHADVYRVYFRTSDGKRRKEQAVGNSRLFDQFFEGERVRHIGRLDYYEKYDKSRDAFLLCAGCGSSRDARDDYCGRCGCVMLKGAPVAVPYAQTAYAPPVRTAPPPAQTRFCPHCGAQIDAGANFCNNCGGRL
ncbi:MAG: zinc-ribbon domain-containing protein [Clostridia bacterium]|nr:zinc-ribbon domain-containing protein [Clostridia bacterium]